MNEPHAIAGMNCEEVLEYLCAQFGEDDDSERCRAVKQHLLQCPDCTTYCTSLEHMIGLYRAASPEFPEQARRGLLATLGIQSDG